MHAHARKAAPARRRPDKTTARGWEGACTVRPSVRGSGQWQRHWQQMHCACAACNLQAKGGGRMEIGWSTAVLCCAGQCCAGVQCSAMGRTRNRTAGPLLYQYQSVPFQLLSLKMHAEGVPPFVRAPPVPSSAARQRSAAQRRNLPASPAGVLSVCSSLLCLLPPTRTRCHGVCQDSGVPA